MLAKMQALVTKETQLRRLIALNEPCHSCTEQPPWLCPFEADYKKNIEKRQKTRKKNGKEYEQAVHSKETQVTNKYMKSSSAMQVTREM